MTIAVILLSVPLLLVPGHASPFGPKYPVTASWFRDRFTYQEWNRTLAEFQQQGGDTVFLRGPPIVKRTREDLMVSIRVSNGWKNLWLADDDCAAVIMENAGGECRTVSSLVSSSVGWETDQIVVVNCQLVYLFLKTRENTGVSYYVGYYVGCIG